MYKGKFESKAVAARAAKRQQEGQETPETVVEEVQVLQPAPETAAPQAAPTQKQDKKEKKRIPTHTIIFYSIYVLFIVVFFVGVHFLLGELDGFLVRYEASQPDVKSREVFNELFADPDWGELYDLAHIEDTAFDGKESFVAYMEEKVGDAELNYLETSMGLSQDKKFFIRIENENIGYFSLSNVAGAVAIPEWDIVDVEIYTEYTHDVTVHSYPGYTVKVNDVALTDEHVIRMTSTHAENYLPEGLHGNRTVSYYLDGLMVQPKITVVNEAGEEMPLSYDAETNAYSHETQFNSISQEQEKAFDTASEIYGRFMITNVGKATLDDYFTGNSYDAITQAELLFIQDYSGYAFTDTVITEFCSYSDTLCSARVQRTMNVTRMNGTIKPYEINTTFFMENKNGKWIVVEMTNADVQAGETTVRLRYMLDGEVLEDQLVSSREQVLIPPEVEAPEGKQLAGWFVQSVNEEGKTVMSLAFQLNEFGEVFVPTGHELEPMILHAVFENKEAE